MMAAKPPTIMNRGALLSFNLEGKVSLSMQNSKLSDQNLKLIPV